MKMAYSFKHRGKTYTAETLSKLSDIFTKERDESYEGASTWQDGKMPDGGRISYNGKIWDKNNNLIFDPYR
jgi:hypothetical protein